MKLYPLIPDEVAATIRRQPVFFTASAPTHLPHINVSPKGLAATHFRILTPNLVAYIDRTGSGNETISHAYENGRLCLMFCSFGPTPGILRLFCKATVVEWDEPAFAGWMKRITGNEAPPFEGTRAIIVAEVWECQTSCGYGVPRVKKGLYAPTDEDGEALPLDPAVEKVLREGFKVNEGEDPKEAKLTELSVFEERPAMDQWAASKTSSNTMLRYQRDNNSRSIDGLPGLRAARRDAGEKGRLWWGDMTARLNRALAEKDGAALGFFIAVVMWIILRRVGIML
ncbi:hypothetical protein NLU13_4202 [Sarocladium strictum]|uniref:Pyridoxamine 5'-phosphate oxidase N-terminal domain-containing protein n=1 Tax=Sarocladium strictum TaxID=5046 RepID=A0AA39GJT5_SARSR|nr:hypothetical protein NLU13_4202 [Sarocladium strictum]